MEYNVLLVVSLYLFLVFHPLSCPRCVAQPTISESDRDQCLGHGAGDHALIDSFQQTFLSTTSQINRNLTEVINTCKDTDRIVDDMKSNIKEFLLQFKEIQTNISVFQTTEEQQIKNVSRELSEVKTRIEDQNIILTEIAELLKGNLSIGDGGSCLVTAGDRCNCGWSGITRHQCTTRGCCFEDAAADNLINCFHPKGSDCDHASRCPDGFVYILRSATCYYLGIDDVTWSQAAENCSRMSGSHVVSVKSETELLGLRDFLHTQQLSAPVAVDDVSTLSGRQVAALIKLGSRVVRGADWKWGTQDAGNGLGTVVRVGSSTTWTRVQWDHGKANNYRMAVSGKYDLGLAFTETEYLVWTSGKKMDNVWKWSSLFNVTYFDWYPGQPDNSGNVEHCLHLTFSPTRNVLKMNDYYCKATSKYVCHFTL